jgi:hypothetical protein
MIEVIVVGEGQTEETFVRDVLTLPLAQGGVMLQCRLIPTSRGSRGGALSRKRVLLFLRNTLRQRGDVYVTTFFDLYGLHPDFPGVRKAGGIPDPLARVCAIEAGFAEEVVQRAGCRPDRFVPHIQPYEFESLLFSDVTRFAEARSDWQGATAVLQTARDGAASPEHINDGQDSHPSARLGKLLGRRYQKVLHGSAVAGRIGLERIRAECAHFGAWLTRLETLPPIQAG